MSSLVLINIELDIIRSFLNNVMITVDSEYANISAMVKAGEFPHYDDEANAYFKPQMWEQIAIRATLGELNVTSHLIETGSFPGNRDHQFYNVISSSFLSQHFPL